jgi:hypothetical protein
VSFERPCPECLDLDGSAKLIAEHSHQKVSMLHDGYVTIETITKTYKTVKCSTCRKLRTETLNNAGFRPLRKEDNAPHI